MKTLPQISYDRERDEFVKDGKPIAFEEAREHWMAVNADWTMGAFKEMAER